MKKICQHLSVQLISLSTAHSSTANTQFMLWEISSVTKEGLGTELKLSTILTLMQLDTMYSLLAKIFNLTLPTDGSFTIVFYSQAAPSRDLLLRLSLPASKIIHFV